MYTKPYFLLEWFSAYNDNLIGDEQLDVTEAQIRKWFYLDDEDPILGSLIVRASQRQHLQEFVKHEIDLNKYDYFIDYVVG